MSETPELDEVDGEPEAAYQRFDCTDPIDDHHQAIDAARRAIEAGDCIVLPTDTVYGIGADAFDGDAVQRLLYAKDRGRDMPPPVLIADSSLIRALATEVSDQAKQLVGRHWPGALTVICTIQPSLRMDLGDTGGTIALRVPDHDLTRAVLRQTGPMAVSSANLSGHPAALTCDEAIHQLGESVAVYLDGGRLGGDTGLPSTIVDFSKHPEGEVLRHGALPIAVLRETLPDLLDGVPAAEPEEDDADDSGAEPVEAADDPRAEPVEAAGDPRAELVEAPVDSPSTSSGHEDAEPVEAPVDSPSTSSGHEEAGSGHEEPVGREER